MTPLFEAIIIVLCFAVGFVICAFTYDRNQKEIDRLKDKLDGLEGKK
jgi:uncharacterized membrane protein YciS (DUF1049 family)